jgi:hypothetical protein
MPHAYVSTPKSAKNYLTLEEKLKMRAILGKEDSEDEENSVEIENKKNLDYLGDPLGSDLDFVAKFGSDSATDVESDQASNKNIVKVCKKAKSVDNYAATPSDLKRHIKTVHEKKKEYKCEMCHEMFSLKNVLTNHIKIVH